MEGDDDMQISRIGRVSIIESLNRDSHLSGGESDEKTLPNINKHVHAWFLFLSCLHRHLFQLQIAELFHNIDCITTFSYLNTLMSTLRRRFRKIIPASESTVFWSSFYHILQKLGWYLRLCWHWLHLCHRLSATRPPPSDHSGWTQPSPGHEVLEETRASPRNQRLRLHRKLAQYPHSYGNKPEKVPIAYKQKATDCLKREIAVTLAVCVAKLTDADITPGRDRNERSTVPEHTAHVIPSIFRSNPVIDLGSIIPNAFMFGGYSIELVLGDRSRMATRYFPLWDCLILAALAMFTVQVSNPLLGMVN